MNWISTAPNTPMPWMSVLLSPRFKMRGIVHNFNCGDWVYDPVDPRHVGRIVAIQDGIWATVEWRPGLVSDPLRLTRLVKYAAL